MKLLPRMAMICLIFTSLFSQSSRWKELPVPIVPGHPYAFADFADSVHGVLASGDGFVTMTSDGGRGWTAPMQLRSNANVLSVKMADSGTALAVAMVPSGPMIYKITQLGANLDSLTIQTKVPQILFSAAMVSILNKDMIGYLEDGNYSTEKNALFIFTMNFGGTWDTLQVTRGVHSSVQAVDTSIIIFARGVIDDMGPSFDGAIYRSDDKGKTFAPFGSFMTQAKIRVFTKENACFQVLYSNDFYHYHTLRLYNIATKQYEEIGDSGHPQSENDVGTIFRDGSKLIIPASSYLEPAEDSEYQLKLLSGSSLPLQFKTAAIAGPSSVWYLTMEGRLFTVVDNPVFVEGCFPLQQGNVWQYQSVDAMNPMPFQTKITGDTLLSNGKRYAVFSNGMLASPFLRQAGSKVYGYDLHDSSEYIVLDYSALAFDTLSRHSNGTRVVVAGGKKADQPSTRKFIEYMNAGASSYVLYDWTILDSVGLVSMTQEPGNAWMMSGAIIDGKTIGTITDVQGNRNNYPTEPVLYQNYPNPFNPSTTIAFSLPTRSFVSLKIFNTLGQKVATIASEEIPAGSYTRQWNASGFPSGIYFYRLQAGAYTATKRLLLLK